MADEIDRETDPSWVRRMKILAVGVFVAAVALGFALFMVLAPKHVSRPAGVGAGPTAITIDVITAVPKTVQMLVTKQASVSARPDVPVQSPNVAWVKGISVAPGQKVKSGERIATIQPMQDEAGQLVASYQSALNDLNASETGLAAAQSNVATAESDYTAQQAALAQANSDLSADQGALRSASENQQTATAALRQQTSELTRNQGLFKQGIISRRELDGTTAARDAAYTALNGANNSLETARNSLADATAAVNARQSAVNHSLSSQVSARAVLRAAQKEVAARQLAANAAKSDVQASQQSTERIPVTAPTDGVIAAVPVRVGTLVTPTMPIAYVRSPNTDVVTFTVNASTASKMKQGMPVDVVLARGKRTLRAVITGFAMTGNQTQVVAQARDPARLLHPGKVVPVRFRTGTMSAMPVPRSAVVSDASGTQVWVDVSGVARIRDVAVAHADPATVWITSGLSPGDIVVTRTDRPLADGARVIPRK